MKLSELIQYVGDEHITFQHLAADFSRGTQRGRSASITFGTKPSVLLDLLEPTSAKELHWVIHIPIEKLPDALRRKARGER